MHTEGVSQLLRTLAELDAERLEQAFPKVFKDEGYDRGAFVRVRTRALQSKLALVKKPTNEASARSEGTAGPKADRAASVSISTSASNVEKPQVGAPVVPRAADLKVKTRGGREFTLTEYQLGALRALGQAIAGEDMSYADVHDRMVDLGIIEWQKKKQAKVRPFVKSLANYQLADILGEKPNTRIRMTKAGAEFLKAHVAEVPA